MKYLVIPGGEDRAVSFYLAAEEYAAEHFDDELFFMWQVDPSVIFGRNQLIENEVNLAFCRGRGIRMFRRKSGGGCVYADRRNIMFSFLVREPGAPAAFARCVGEVAGMLRSLGVPAEPSGRNDILVRCADGTLRKVSGYAFYGHAGRSIVHGTMLYDTDMECMAGSITPSGAKLLSKGISSVRQRITLLREHMPLALPEFMRRARESLCDGEVALGVADLEAVAALEQEYLSDSFVFGHNPKYTVERRERIEGVGELQVRMEIKNRTINGISLTGDFFALQDLSPLLQSMEGAALERRELELKLPEKLEDYIRGLSRSRLIGLLLS